MPDALTVLLNSTRRHKCHKLFVTRATLVLITADSLEISAL